jgi:hypothetical protein
MYKLVIEIGDWSWDEEQTVTIETSDFDKVQIIQEFIEFQKDHGWAADYELSQEYVDSQCDEENEEEVAKDEEELEVGDLVEDEDGLVWELVG